MPPQASWTRSHASASGRPGRQLDAAAGRGVPHRVGQQVAHHAGQLGVAARHRRPPVGIVGRDHLHAGAPRPLPPRPPPRRRRPRRAPAGRGRAAARRTWPGRAGTGRRPWRPSGSSPAGRGRGSRRPRRAGAPPRRPARRPSPGSRPAGSAGRGSSSPPAPGGRPRPAAPPPGPPAARAPRGRSRARAAPPTGTVTTATTTTTARVPASCGVYMKPLTATTPPSAATSGTSASVVIAAVTDRRRMRCRSRPPSARHGQGEQQCRGQRPAPARRARQPSRRPQAGVVAVAGAPDRGDPPRLRRVGLDLLPQPADVHGDRRLVAELPPPHLREQLRAGEGPAGVGEQERQQVELAGGERERRAGQGRAPGAPRSTRRSPSDQRAGVRGRGRCPAQHGADAQHQLAGAERLAHVVVGAQLEAADPVVLLAERGEHHDRGRGRPSAQRAAHVEPTGAGEHQVEHDGVRAVARGGRAGRPRRPRRGRPGTRPRRGTGRRRRGRSRRRPPRARGRPSGPA